MRKARRAASQQPEVVARHNLGATATTSATDTATVTSLEATAASTSAATAAGTTTATVTAAETSIAAAAPAIVCADEGGDLRPHRRRLVAPRDRRRVGARGPRRRHALQPSIGEHREGRVRPGKERASRDARWVS